MLRILAPLSRVQQALRSSGTCSFLHNAFAPIHVPGALRSKLDNVIVTPHALCWTDQMFERIGATDMQAVLDLSRGRVPAGIVDRAVLDNPIWQRRLARYAVS